MQQRLGLVMRQRSGQSPAECQAWANIISALLLIFDKVPLQPLLPTRFPGADTHSMICSAHGQACGQRR